MATTDEDMLGIGSLSQSSKESSGDSLNHIEQQSAGSTPSVVLNISNVFWRPNLSCHPYEYGDRLVSFGELWPGEDRLAPLVSCFAGPEMQDAVMDCCMLVLRCGPVRVLKQLLEQKIIGLDQIFEHGMTMLHIACLASHLEAVAFLISRGIDFKRSDKTGRTADLYCFSSKTRRALPARYHAGVRSLKKRSSSAHDKKTIFDLAQNQASLEELQFKLHTMEFDVNHDRNARGDLLIHVAVKAGLSQLALLINLVKNHGANVEAHDQDGMTPLCLAAKCDMDTITEVLICVLGADPNSYNHVNRWAPLHFAAKRNHLKIIDTLCKRGADVNQEDNFATRPDDLAMHWGNDECCTLIDCLRVERCEKLSYLAQEGNLKSNLVRYTDLFNADMEGKTLIMVAAEANRCDNLSVLLRNSKSPINAQNIKTGQTALTLATIKGHEVAVKTLLGFKALPGIRDMMGHVALHYAARERYVQIVKDLVQEDVGLTGLFEALRCTKHEEIRGVLRDAMERRQTVIVNPALFESAMDGDADRIFCIIEEGDDMNPVTGTGDWPMYMAAGNGHLEVMQLLYENGGDVSGRHPNTKSTVLHVACSRGLYKIVKYLLQFCKYGGYIGFFATTNVSCYQELDINALNNHGQTALQVAASKGYSRIVKILLEYGASSAVLDLKGQLYKCREFDGVQVLIERHRRTRTEQIMLCIKDRKRLGYLRRMWQAKFRPPQTPSVMMTYLQKIWQAKFDHNLRNKNGDTPLMVACYYGRTEAVKFLLESAIQSLEDEERDFERSMQQWRRDFDDDSGTFENSHSPTQIRRSLASLADMSTDMSTTDYSDQEFTERQEPFYTQRDAVEKRESSAYHRRRRKKRAQFMMANASLDEGDETGGAEGGYVRHRPLPYVSDSEMFEDSYEGMQKGYGGYNQGYGGYNQGYGGYNHGLPSIHSGASLHSSPAAHPSLTRLPYTNPLYLHGFIRTPGSSRSSLASPYLRTRLGLSFNRPSCKHGYTDVPGRFGGRNNSVYSYGGGTLSMWGGMSDTSGGRISPSMSEYFGQQTGPSIFQGNQVNHLCAVNLRDSSTCFHRAVECADQKSGLAIIGLLLDKDKSVVNTQNIKGMTPLHLACQLEKKKIVKKLVSLEYVDINIRTLDGKLAEDLTRSKRLAKLVQSTRERPADGIRTPSPYGERVPTPPLSSVGGASIDFDRLTERFEELRKSGHRGSKH